VRVLGLPGALVLGARGTTLLWAPAGLAGGDPGAPGGLGDVTLEALRGAALDGVALDVRYPGPAAGTSGAGVGAGAGAGVAHAVARLRGADALAPGCDVVAVGRTHENVPRALARLDAWGVRVAVDGEPWPVRRPPVPAPHRTLVLGAAASGKSLAAEDLLAAEPAVVYAATGPVPTAEDPGWVRRVEEHRRRRPAWWTTDETGDLVALLGRPGPPLLVDSLGAWLTSVMDRWGAWDDEPGWRGRVDREVESVVQGWRQSARRVVAVGEEVGWGVVPATPAGRRFRDVLGVLHQRIAAQSERVLLVAAGQVVPLGADGWSQRLGQVPGGTVSGG
jgi:adenosylcobinamide kinase/adenosylcobinamide-phosphate guanylyltransferase